MATRRIASILHHVVTLCRPDELGATKLAKILWFADLEFFRRTGRTITQSDDYRKDDQGPLHREFYAAVDLLKAEGHIGESFNPTPVGSRREFLALSMPDLSDFTSEEIATIDRVVARVKPMSAKAISDETHDELWQEARRHERIPVAAAAVIFGDVPDDIVEWAATELRAGADRAAPERV